MTVERLVGVPTFLAIVLTLAFSPILVALYRRRISFWMRAGSDRQAESVAQMEAASAAPYHPAKRRSHSPAATCAPSALDSDARSSSVRLALAYGAGGLAHTALLTGVFGIARPDLMSSLGMGTAMLVFMIPTLATVLYLFTASPMLWIATIGAVFLVSIAMLGHAGPLALLMFELHVLVPAVLFLVFNARPWRGIAPLLLLVLAFASVSWVFAAEFMRALGAQDGLVMWMARIAGFLTGAWIGYKALQKLRTLNDAGWLSDEEIFLDSWWLLYTIVQTVINVITFGAAFFLTFLLFPVYFLVKRCTCRMLGLGNTGRRPLRLLLLRVFGYDARAQRLFDYLDRRWRFIGKVELIAGRDLATRNIGPLEFSEFLSARLQQRFITGLDALEARLRVADDSPYPDGRFRAEHYYCRDDTWQPAMRALAADCDVVLMDLRGFEASNAGARYELEHLSRTAPRKPVVLLADEQTERGELSAVLAERKQSGNWQVIPSSSARQLSSVTLMKVLANAVARSGRSDASSL